MSQPFTYQGVCHIFIVRTARVGVCHRDLVNRLLFQCSIIVNQPRIGVVLNLS